MERQEVFVRLNDEREYQTALWGDQHHSVEEYLLYTESYLAEAKKVMCRTADSAAIPAALPIIRKVAALALACLEEHGCPPRDFKDLKRSCELHAVRGAILSTGCILSGVIYRVRARHLHLP